MRGHYIFYPAGIVFLTVVQSMIDGLVNLIVFGKVCMMVNLMNDVVGIVLANEFHPDFDSKVDTAMKALPLIGYAFVMC